ncbi:MAG: glycosyltransferase family 39 protein [Acidobacteriaceae bacterium]|nr:glycosyltransferase family 39 protein [Acidobacteriaceae bacterium]
MRDLTSRFPFPAQMRSMVEAPPIESKTRAAGGILAGNAGHLFTGSLVVLLLALFMGFIFNRSLPINEGWYYYYAWLMHKGQFPYRDFWFISQPFDLCIAYLFAGDHLINLRIFGVVERIALTGMLYFLLSRHFSARASFLATLLSMVMLLTYLTEGFFTFLIDSLTFLIAGFICVYEAYIHPRHCRWLLLLAGCLGSLCFFSKQSTGFFATLALAALIVWPAFDLRRILPKLVYFSIGWWLLAAPVITWLVMNHAWSAYVLEVFKGAAASKGSLKTVLFTTFIRNFQPKMLALDITVLLLIYLGARTKFLQFGERATPVATKREIALTALVALVVLFVPVLFHFDEAGVELMRKYLAVLAKLIFMGMCVLVCWLLVRRFRPHTRTLDLVVASLVLGGFLWGYGCQISNKVEQHAIVLGFAFLIAAACDHVFSRSGRPYVGVVTVVCLLQLAQLALYKYNDAYDWNGWRSVIALDYTRSSHWPQLAGFRVDGESIHMFDTILDDIARGAKPGEPIFTFPHMPMFNFITGHPQPTFAPVHYWDVCPDYIAIADAARVKAAKPAIIVEMDMPEWLWGDGEMTFRQGNRSGQREIKNVIAEFAVSDDYRLMDTFRTPWVHTRINVWQRVK